MQNEYLWYSCFSMQIFLIISNISAIRALHCKYFQREVYISVIMEFHRKYFQYEVNISPIFIFSWKYL